MAGLFIGFDVCVSASWNRFLECFLFFLKLEMESQKEPLGAALTTYQPVLLSILTARNGKAIKYLSTSTPCKKKKILK